MKRLVKILAIIVAAFALIIITMCVTLMMKMKSQVGAFDLTEVDVSSVKDGVYEGHSETELVKAEVRVTVTDGKITDIEILKHECGKGRPAEKMLPSMIEQNDVEVDAVSGATYSSTVIKDAVRNALRKGI